MDGWNAWGDSSDHKDPFDSAPVDAGFSATAFDDGWQVERAAAPASDSWIIPDVLPSRASVVEDAWAQAEDGDSNSGVNAIRENFEVDSAFIEAQEHSLDLPEVQQVVEDPESDEFPAFELDHYAKTPNTNTNAELADDEEWGSMSLPNLKEAAMPQWEAPNETFDLPAIPALPEWSLPIPMHALSVSRDHEDAVASETYENELQLEEDTKVDSVDPWAAGGQQSENGAVSPTTSSTFRFQLTPEQIATIVAEARKITLAAVTESNVNTFAPPKGMGLNFDALMSDDGELHSLKHYTIPPIPQQLRFINTKTHKSMITGIEKTAAKSAEFLKASTTRRQAFKPLPFQESSWPNGSGQAAPIAHRNSSLDNARVSTDSRSSSGVRPSTDISSPPASPQAGPSKIRSFLNRFSRAASPLPETTQTSAPSKEDWLGTNDIAILDSGGVTVPREMEEGGTYSQGGLLADDSPTKVTNSNGIKITQNDDLDFLSAFSAAPRPLSTRPPTDFDLFDPLSANAAPSIQRDPIKQTTTPPFDIFAPVQAQTSGTNSVIHPSKAIPPPQPFQMPIRTATPPVASVKLAPPPPSHVPVKSGGSLLDTDDDDFGDFASSNVPSMPPPKQSQPVQTKLATETKGAARADWSFFDNL